MKLYTRDDVTKANIVKMNTNSLLVYFRPSIYVSHFSKVNLDELKRHGIKLFITDLDNTLAPHFQKFPKKDAIDFIQKLKDKGFKVAVISNNTKKRVDHFVSKLPEVDFKISGAKKPFPHKIKKIMKENNIDASEIIIMGDQIVMDTIVANIIKCDSILVNPLGLESKLVKKFINYLEQRVYKRLSKENILHKNEYEKNYKGGKYDII